MLATHSEPFAQWLSKHRQPPDTAIDVDAVVIGSGYGGAVAALRLAEASREVLVLERGAEFQPGDFPNHAGQLPKFLRARGRTGTLGNVGGLFDFRIGQGMASLVANGLGGGSLINAGVMMRPDDDVFAQQAWPAEIRHKLDERRKDPTGRALGLDAAFSRAASMLRGEVFQDKGPVVGNAGGTAAVSQLPKAQALQRMGQAMQGQISKRNCNDPDRSLTFQAEPAKVTIDLDNCKRCGDCFTGCNVPGAKRTLLTTYLQDARAAGAQLISGALVYSIEPDGEGHWLLRVMPASNEKNALHLGDAVRRDGRILRARLVVVAAGTFGSTELLMRSQRCTSQAFTLSPALGTRLSGNGDSLSVLADLDRRVEGVGHGAEAASKRKVGPTITTVLDLRGRRQIDQRVVIQEGAAPGALAAIYRELLATTWTLRHLGVHSRIPKANNGLEPLAATDALAAHTQMLLAMGHDGSRGRLVWMPEMDGVVPFWMDPAKEPAFARQQELFDIAQSGGGVHLHPPTWRAVDPALGAAADGELPSASMMSVHPLGGCPMGDTFDNGVVDHKGQVWRGPHALWDNLYVLDGSVVPTSLGCNPLWTITALTERAMVLVACGAPSEALRVPRAAPPTDQACPSAPVRHARPTSRDANPAIDLEITERLEKRQIHLHGRLRRALGPHAEGDIDVQMRSADWMTVWNQPRHRIDMVSGRLRLLAKDPDAAAAPGNPTRAEYQITGGHVDLFNQDEGLFRHIARLARLPRVFVTWFLLRGQRDRREPRLPGAGRIACKSIWNLAVAATENRFVRYQLGLVIALPKRGESATSAATPSPQELPARLWLTGQKKITYAASWTEIAIHLWKRCFGSKDPATARRPGDLRASLFHQLTQPLIHLDETPWRHTLPPWLSDMAACLPGLAAERYDFDAQTALQHTPVRVRGGGDSTTVALAALAYPAFVARYLLQARLLEFRLPTYSSDPLPDAATPDDVSLRIVPPGWTSEIEPTEYSLEVPLGLSSSDDGTQLPAGSLLRLRLWRYARPGGAPRTYVSPTCAEGSWCGNPVRKAKSVVLMHAFDMSGHSFTFKTTTQNFAEHLYSEGWEVWILDSRMSPRTRASIEPCTVDQLGFIDAPHAVDFILGILRGDLGAEGPPLQIFGFGQCMGAASLLIGLLGGRLSYDIQGKSAHENAKGIVSLMPKLAGLVTSQTHPFIVGSRTAQAKTWIPSLLRDYAGRTMIPLGVRGPVQSVAETLADRLFAGLPVPAHERCHNEGEVSRVHDDDCATCRRIRFLLGGMFLHANLNEKTHAELPRLFGAGSVRLFAQGAKFFRYERLTSEDGHNVYVTDDAIARYLALPLRFVHGCKNDLFNHESATRSGFQYRRVLPGWADRYGRMDPKSGKKQVFDLIPGYGHVDVLIGQAAMLQQGQELSAYQRLSGLLTEAWSSADAGPSPSAGSHSSVIVRFPLSGPFLGPIRTRNGRRVIGISFIVDDTTADVPLGAAALFAVPGHRRMQPLELSEIKVAVPARDGQFTVPCADALIGLRVAFGEIDITDHATGSELRVRCVSYARVFPGAVAPTLPTAFGAGPTGVTQRELENAIVSAQRTTKRLRAIANRPFPLTLSQRLRLPPWHLTMRASIAEHVLREPADSDTVRVAIGCCRYGGFQYERDRADAALQRLVQIVRDKGPTPRPELLFLLGDQIYADRTAGLFDELSPIERFFARHQQAFTSIGARKLFSSIPTVCLADDHEFADSYPLGRPLLRRGLGQGAQSREAESREHAAYAVAVQAFQAYQISQLPTQAKVDGYCTVDRGRVRFFVLDTRLRRRRRKNGSVVTTSAVARKAFRQWVRKCAESDVLACLVTGSVILPGLHEGADPANMGPVDTLQAAPAERAWLLGELATHVPHRFVLLSGEYHVSFAGQVCLDGQPVGAAIVAPPLYAPLVYANAQPEDLWLGEPVRTAAGCIQVEKVRGYNPIAGSGFGTLEFIPDGRRWKVRLREELIDFERYDGLFSVGWPDIDLG